MKQLTAIILIIFLTSCVETIVVGSVTASHLATREKTLLHTKDDINITSQIVKNFSTSVYILLTSNAIKSGFSIK